VGLRAGLLCIPALLIYVLRIAQWHVGERNTASPIEYLERYVFSRSSLTTVVVYAASAFLYGEVYIWSRAGKAQLGMTVEGLYHERIRLNERPLFLRSLFVSQGVIQAVIHVARNKDCVPIPVAQSTRRKRTHLQRKLVGIVAEGGMLAILTLLLGSLAYFLGLRQFVWSWWYSVAQNVYSLAKTSKPSGLVPFMPLLVRFLIQSTILSCIWQFSNQTFDSFMAQAPLKNGKPITTDSKDPNGSLLNGLRMKKEEAKVCRELWLPLDRLADF
jgi:nucleoporin NDC1